MVAGKKGIYIKLIMLVLYYSRTCHLCQKSDTELLMEPVVLLGCPSLNITHQSQSLTASYETDELHAKRLDCTFSGTRSRNP